jgi:hypothetical protein
MAIKYIIVLFVETPRKFITAKLSIRKPGFSSVLIDSTDEDHKQSNITSIINNYRLGIRYVVFALLVPSCCNTLEQAVNNL